MRAYEIMETTGKAVLSENLQEIVTGMSPARVGRFQQAVELAKQYDQQGLFAAQLKDVKDQINRGLEEAWRKLFQEKWLWNGQASEMTEDEYNVANIVTFAPTCHTAPGYLKRVLAAKSGHGPMRDDMIRLLNDIMPLATMVNGLKDKVGKREVKPSAEVVKAQYMAPAASGTATAKVREVLDGLIKDVRDDMIDYMTSQLNRYVDRFLSTQAEKYAESKKRFSAFEMYWARDARVRNRDAYDICSAATTNDQVLNYHKVAERKPNADEIIATKAVEIVDEMCSDFIYKNLRKLSSIVDAKTNLIDVKPLGRINPVNMEGAMQFSFADGASFSVKLQVVYAVSKLGKLFARFPLIFQNVIMADGSKMKGASEERMNTEFATAK